MNLNKAKTASTNGKPLTRDEMAKNARMAMNLAMANVNQALSEMLIQRTSASLSVLDPPNRDLNNDCGYPVVPTIEMYQQLYDRVGTATRVVEVYPDETWSVYPELYEKESPRQTTFERAWNDLLEKHNLWYFLDRIDRLSGIGRYGVILLGLDDGKDMSEPVDGIDEKGEKVAGGKQHKLLYVRVFSEKLARVDTIELDTSNPRYGQPKTYSLQFTDTTEGQATLESERTTNITVHWSRIIHICDNRMSSEVYGVPRMRPVVNDIYDIRKIGGGAGEMFWRGAFPGIVFETLPELSANVDIDDDSLRQQFEDWGNHLKRYLAVAGGTIKPLLPAVADPTPFLTQKFLLICVCLKVPLRVFTGSEAAHLASTQDIQTWNRRLGRRQKVYVTPMVIKPLVERLILLGVLPPLKKGFTVDWTDLNSLSDEQKADVASKKTMSLMQYVTSGAEEILPLLFYLTDILGLSEERAQAIMDALNTDSKRFTTDIWGMPQEPPGMASTADPTAKTGAPRNSQGTAIPGAGKGRRRAVTGRNVTTTNEEGSNNADEPMDSLDGEKGVEGNGKGTPVVIGG